MICCWEKKKAHPPSPSWSVYCAATPMGMTGCGLPQDMGTSALSCYKDNKTSLLYSQDDVEMFLDKQWHPVSSVPWLFGGSLTKCHMRLLKPQGHGGFVITRKSTFSLKKKKNWIADVILGFISSCLFPTNPMVDQSWDGPIQTC